MFRFLCNRLKGRPDSEHEMSFNRIILISLVIGYAGLISYYGWDDGANIIVPIAIGGGIHIALGLVLFAHILWKPDACPPRRVIAMVADLASVTLSIHYGGEWCLWQYPLLLWITFGNGFRFGIRYLFMAAAISVACFSFLLLFNPFWHRYPALSWGSLMGLVILPAYVSILIRKLSDSIELVEQANRAKSLFLASISHELRTPLNAIIGLSDLMKSTRLTAEQADMSQTIGDAGRTLLSLINSVLDLSRLEVGKMPFVMEPVDLYAVLNRIHRITGVIAEGKGLKTYLQIAPDVPQFISASTRQIEEIITNLMSNAVKFTETGYVLVRVRAEAIVEDRASLSFEISDTGIGMAEGARSTIFERFMQADETIVSRFGGTGLGLAIVKQMVEQGGGTIAVDSTLGKGSTFTVRMDFEMLAQSANTDLAGRSIAILSHDDHFVGGLRNVFPNMIVTPGVAQAQALLNEFQIAGQRKPILFVDLQYPCDMIAMIDLISGKNGLAPAADMIAVLDPVNAVLDNDLALYFSTLVEKTASPHLLANAVRIAAGFMVAAGGPEPADLFASRTKGNVLVADDNKTNQKVIGKILERGGHTVEFADNGQIAVEKLLNGNFDIAFMDINMPVVNGIEAMKLYLIASLGQRQTPVFALTADVTDETRKKCLDAGMKDALNKPIEPAQLLAVIDEHILAAGASGAQTSSEPQGRSGNEPDAERVVATEPIDTLALNDLAELGGSQFVREVVEQFTDDAIGILDGLTRAVETQDYRAFRDELHALRSGAANVGARKVFQSCLKWREIAPEELSLNGEYHLLDLRNQLDEARELLKAHIDNGSFVTTPMEETRRFG